jgi:hypothetical protein
MNSRWRALRFLVIFIGMLLGFGSCQKDPVGSDKNGPGDDMNKHQVEYATFEEVGRLERGTPMFLCINREGTAVRRVEVAFESTYDFEYQRLIFCRTQDDTPIGAGDSGSPVFLEDGRIAGMLCYGYSGNNHQFAARTIEDVLTVGESGDEGALARNAEPFLRPILPVGFSARIDPSYLARMKKSDRFGFFARLAAAQSVFSGAAPAKSASAQADSVVPGTSIAVFEMSGDLLNLGAIGSVGAMAPDKWYAFGHSYSFFPTPLAAPTVLATTATFIESSDLGFKYAQPTSDTVGAFTAQNSFGILVQPGVRPITFPIMTTIQYEEDSPIVLRHRISSTESPAYEKYLGAFATGYAVYVALPAFIDSDSLFARGSIRIQLQHAVLDTALNIAGTETIDSDVFDFIDTGLRIAEGGGRIIDFQANIRIAGERSALSRR